MNNAKVRTIGESHVFAKIFTVKKFSVAALQLLLIKSI